MTQVTVKVKVKVGKGKGSSEPSSAPKQRKSRKDKGTKRGKKGTANPQFQTGSINMRTIGTSATIGPNLTRLAGLISSSRQITPTLAQDNKLMDELRRTNIELGKSTELALRKPDVNQGQEETPSEVGNELLHAQRTALTNTIKNLRNEEQRMKESNQMSNKTFSAMNFLQKVASEKQINKSKEDIEGYSRQLAGYHSIKQKQDVMISANKAEIKDLTQNIDDLKKKGQKFKNYIVKKQSEIQVLNQNVDELTQTRQKQKEDLIRDVNFIQKPELLRMFKEQGEEVSDLNDIEDLRATYLRMNGLRINEDYTYKSRQGKKGMELIPFQKQDLQRGQEERPISLNQAEETQLKKTPIQEFRLSSDEEAPVKPPKVKRNLKPSPKRTNYMDALSTDEDIE